MQTPDVRGLLSGTHGYHSPPQLAQKTLSHLPLQLGHLQVRVYVDIFTTLRVPGSGWYLKRVSVLSYSFFVTWSFLQLVLSALLPAATRVHGGEPEKQPAVGVEVPTCDLGRSCSWKLQACA